MTDKSKPKDIRLWTTQQLVEELPPNDADIEKIEDQQLIVLAEYSKRNTWPLPGTYDEAIRNKILPELMRRLRDCAENCDTCRGCGEPIGGICGMCL